jgi:PAS domain S-box-containing protein
MAGVVPEPGQGLPANPLHFALGLNLEALLEFLHAASGWIGLKDDDGRLWFPVRRGNVSDYWLKLHGGREYPWGFAVREGPTLLNSFPAWPTLGAIQIDNLLTCPIGTDSESRGHLAVANKSGGFNSHDAEVVQAVAHLMAKQLSTPAFANVGAASASVLPHQVFDRAEEGVFVTDDRGTLVYANSRWIEWTGFSPEELLQQRPPYSFWISHRHLGVLHSSGSLDTDDRLRLEAKGNLAVVPFRRADDSIFWCQLETTSTEWSGRRWVVAWLRQQPAAGKAKDASVPGAVLPGALLATVGERLPCAAVLSDHTGRVVWANAAAKQCGLLPRNTETGEAAGFLPGQFALSSAAALKRALCDSDRAEPERFGRLVLKQAADSLGKEWVAYWLSIPAAPGLPEGGCWFVFADDWDRLCLPDELAADWRRSISMPGGESLALLLRAGREVCWWNERWEKRTGLAAADLAGVPSELVLDWLFPQQADRQFIGDLLLQPPSRASAAQSVLQVLEPGGSRPCLCTFLAVDHHEQTPSHASEDLPADSTGSWLLLVGEPPMTAAGASPHLATTRYIRQFARGLSHLLNHYLTPPIGLSEMALERSDMPAEFVPWFEQILESCRQVAYLIGALQDLAIVELSEKVPESLCAIVQEVLAERTPAESICEVGLELPTDEATVLVDRRLVRVALRHLLSNAEQALLHCVQPRIIVRVRTEDEEVSCEIEDNGEGVATADWSAVFAPFYSTKGPFARDAAHAALPATGLGLTVSSHLVALHGGRLELRSSAGEGATATIYLPRAKQAVPPAPAGCDESGAAVASS